MAPAEKVTPESRRITVWLSEDLIARADRLAQRGDLDRGKLLRNIIEVGIDSLEQSEKVGLLQFSLLMRDMRDALNRWVEELKNDGLKRFWS